MKAFTVYQPYAHAIVAGVKHYETRPRRTNIRGRVAVHAGRLDEVQATKHLTNGEFWAVLEAAGGGGNLPRGAVIGTVEIVDCVPVEELVDSLDNRERLLGDYSLGRFAWVLQNPVMFKTPIPAHGKHGLFVYAGPSLPHGRLKEHAVFNGTFEDVKAYLADVLEDYPQAERLIVPVERLSAFAAKVKTPGNIAHKYYNDIVSTMRGNKEV